MTNSDHGTSDHGTVVSLPNGSVRVEGHLDLVATADGVRPVRIPVRHWTHFPPAGEVLRAMASNASGVRLRVETEATRLTLRVRCTRIRIGEAMRPGDAFVARVDGADVAVATAPDTQTLAISPAGDEAALVSHSEDSLIELAPPFPQGGRSSPSFCRRA